MVTPCLLTIHSFFVSAIYGLARGLYAYPDSVYRTFLRFPHRLTIPAFEEYYAVLQCFFACIICSFQGDIQAPYAGTIFYDPLPVLRICSDFSSLPTASLRKKSGKRNATSLQSQVIIACSSCYRHALFYFCFRKPIKTEVEISGRTYLLVVPDR